MRRSRLEAFVSIFVSVHPHEISALLHSFSCFFFILSAYFVVLPLRDDGAISLGLSKLPGLFLGSLVLTLMAAPVSTLIFSSHNLSKAKALVLIHRFFSVSLFIFFILWHLSAVYSPFELKRSSGTLSTSEENETAKTNQRNPGHLVGWENHGWFYVSVRIGLFLWVALLNLITISSTWARVIDVMNTESGSRLFGFVGAGATLGQLFGSLFATGMAWLGPFLLLFAALLMEFAAQSSKGIKLDASHISEEHSLIREGDSCPQNEADGQTLQIVKGVSPKSPTSVLKPQLWAILDGLQLIMASTYLLHVSLFLWLSAVVSSFFYFQKVSVIAMTVSSSEGRRRLFAQINSFIAIFILAGQLTLTGHILTVAGITVAICSAPVVAFSNFVALSVWPNWVAVAVSETLRKVVTYVVTRPGRELLFTVVSQEEKYKAKVCIDVLVQRLGDAAAAGMYKLLLRILNGKMSMVSLFVLPVSLLWIVTAFHLGRRQAQLAKHRADSTS